MLDTNEEKYKRQRTESRPSANESFGAVRFLIAHSQSRGSLPFPPRLKDPFFKEGDAIIHQSGKYAEDHY